MTTDKIPYTHWSYFPDEASARRCAQELADYVIRVHQPEEGAEWLLLAGRDVEVGRLVERHEEVEAIVERHGGQYDGGGVEYLDGQPVVDSALAQPGNDPN